MVWNVRPSKLKKTFVPALAVIAFTTRRHRRSRRPSARSATRASSRPCSGSSSPPSVPARHVAGGVVVPARGGRARGRSCCPARSLFAFGVQVLHIVTVLWIAHVLESKTDTYGAIGAALAILLWAYLLGSAGHGRRGGRRRDVAATPRPDAAWRRRADRPPTSATSVARPCGRRPGGEPMSRLTSRRPRQWRTATPSEPKRVPRWRRILVGFLVVVGCVLAPISIIGVWVHNTLLDTDQWVDDRRAAHRRAPRAGGRGRPRRPTRWSRAPTSKTRVKDAPPEPRRRRSRPPSRRARDRRSAPPR